MESDSGPAVAGASMVAILENPETGPEAEAKKGGRFSRKKDKKKAAKPAKPEKNKNKKSGKDKGGNERATSPENDRGPGVVNDSDFARPVRPNLGAVPGRDADVLGFNGDDPVRRDSGIEDGSGRLTDQAAQGDGSQTPSDSQHTGVQEEEESGVVDHQRDKSRSRSGSRKRFSFFRRRGRSGGRHRSKSETDVSKMGRKEPSRRHDSAEDVKSRNSSSLDRERGGRAKSEDRKGRHSPVGPDRSRQSLSVDRDLGRHAASSVRGRGRQTASMERDPFAYRRYDPAKQPRDRLQHMTVKDAVTEYKHRVRNLSANAAVRKRAAAQRKVSSSVPDISSTENGQPGEEEQLLLDPEQRTRVTAVATLPRQSRPPGEPMSQDGVPAVEDCAEDSHMDGPSTSGYVSSDYTPRRNLGEQIVKLCRTISDERGSEREVDEDLSGTCDRTDAIAAEHVSCHNSGGDLPRNVNSVLYINPEDIVVEGDQSAFSSRDRAVGSAEPSHEQAANVSLGKDGVTQPRLKPLGQFMELRKSAPAFSSSPIARERRKSQSDESNLWPLGVTHRSSRQSRDASSENIPTSGSRNVHQSPSPKLSGSRDMHQGSFPKPSGSCDVYKESSPKPSGSREVHRDSSPKSSGSRDGRKGSSPKPSRSRDARKEMPPKPSGSRHEHQGSSPKLSGSRDVHKDTSPRPRGPRDLQPGPSTKSVLPKSAPQSATLSKLSPEITVNLAHPTDSPPSSEMVSSTDSWKTKRSSDQGFCSEPKESDSESEGEASGFSTPPEEPELVKGGPRHPITPAVFVNTVKNLLEVPKPRKINRSNSEDAAVESGRADQSCTRSDSTKSDSYVQSLKAKQSSSNDAHPEKFEQKTVPVMGTSVQQKYRRTFSPVRGKGTEQFKGEEPVIEILTTESTTQPQASVQGVTKPEEAKQSIDDGTFGQEEDDLAKRGRDSQRRRGYVSGRSFRMKKEKEPDGPQPPTDSAKPAQPKDEDKDNYTTITDDISNRLAFLDKSIQTSDSLLNDLIKKTKVKRKMSLFSSGLKKSKRHSEAETAVPVRLPPPPKYEEERHLGLTAEVRAEPLTQDSGRSTAITPAEIVLAEAQRIDDGAGPGGTPDSHEPVETVAEQQNIALPAEPTAPKPKSSLRAIVALKQRLARNRQRKAKAKKAQENEEEEGKKIDDDLPSDTFIHIENEINLSKLAEIKETDILDDEIFEPDFGPALPKKQIRFEPVASDEPIQSEEPLPPLSPSSRRLTARRNSTRGRERRKKCIHCCKKFIAFLFSHIGLCSLVAGYTFMGGIVFQALEAPYEMDVKHDITRQREKLVDKIHSLATGYSLNEVNRDNLTSELNRLLIEYQQFIHTETKDSGWDGKEVDPKTDPNAEEYTQWSFASALLYAITVMTTIGYGHVAPKTSYGRVVTIAYAVLGIPLTLLCLTNIGDVMATGFRLLYGKVCCGVCCKLFKPSRRRRRRVPDVEKGLGRQVVTEEGETDKPKEVIQVPTSLCLLLIAGYIFAGALMFSLWEQWDYLTGSYFCFITLSTIGFGDIVPGTNMGDWNQEEKLVLSALYLVFGLSLIAMCFNLVQEDVKAKCRWIGMKIGIIDKPEPPV